MCPYFLKALATHGDRRGRVYSWQVGGEGERGGVMREVSLSTYLSHLQCRTFREFVL